ncbi:MAG: hypothetical protein ABSD59_24560 [Terracidiphilus sp.]|jgi:hypothetical protein
MPISENAKRVLIGIALLIIGAILGFAGFKMSEKSKNSHGIIDAADSPVTVRGGSMTARTRDQNGWQVTGNSFCTNLPYAVNLYFQGLRDKYGSLPSTSPIMLSGNWSVTVQGREHGNNTTPHESGNGIMFTPSSTECGTASTSSNSSILLSPYGSYGGFYNDPAVADLNEGSSTVMAERFEDLTPDGSTATTHCEGPNSSMTGGDEDVCERASRVTIKTGTAGSQITYEGWCLYGECAVWFDNK